MADVHDVLLQGKQRLLYSLLDAMQSLTSQAVVIGMSCRLVWTELSHALVAFFTKQVILLFIVSLVLMCSCRMQINC